VTRVDECPSSSFQGREVAFGRIEHLGREGTTHRVRLSIPDACGLDALPPFVEVAVRRRCVETAREDDRERLRR
jgi:hypothetical protein